MDFGGYKHSISNTITLLLQHNLIRIQNVYFVFTLGAERQICPLGAQVSQAVNISSIKIKWNVSCPLWKLGSFSFHLFFSIFLTIVHSHNQHKYLKWILIRDFFEFLMHAQLPHCKIFLCMHRYVRLIHAIFAKHWSPVKIYFVFLVICHE